MGRLLTASVALVSLFVLPLPAASFYDGARGVDGQTETLKIQTIFPSAPGKNKVRWWAFDWKYTDFHPVEGGAPVRLFFYEEERDIATTAKPQIARAYEDFTTSFEYTPSETIPFLLYNSHFEFASTTAFFVQEGVLGVTSTRDLMMALPYWGEHLQFNHVMRHELAHQFTIQKIWDLDTPCNALQQLPLWFVEGVAEVFSLQALTPEVRGFIADRLRDDDQKLIGFWEEYPMTFERVYLLGHAQVRFLEERYGEGTIRRLLAEAGRLCGIGGFFSSRVDFANFVGEVVGAPPEGIAATYEEWAKEVAGATINAPPLTEVKLGGIGRVDSYSLSPDGRVIFFRKFDYATGKARLYMQAVDDADTAVEIAEDGGVFLVSLHPRDRRVTALSNDTFVYIGRRGESDIVFVGRYKRESKNGGIRVDPGDTMEHKLSDYAKLIEAGAPAIHPQTGSVAFIALSRDTGLLDVYRFDRPFSEEPPLVRMTNDEYAEQDAVYLPHGVLLVSTDATPDGRYEIMRVGPGGIKIPLTSAKGDHDTLSPGPDREGGFVFQSGVTGKMQAYRTTDDDIVRISNVATILENPSVDGDGDLLGIVLIDGEQRLMRLPRTDWLSIAEPAMLPSGTIKPFDLPRSPLENVKKYDAYALKNYGLEAAQLLFGGGLLIGSVVFTDVLKGHIAGAAVQAFGDDRIDSEVFYFDRSARTAFGASAFVRTGLQLSPNFVDEQETFVLQRYGISFISQYPFNRYIRVEGFISPQALRAFDFSLPRSDFAREHKGTVPAVEAGGGVAFDTLVVSRYGPIDGWAANINLRGTLVTGDEDPFATGRTELQAYQPLIPGYQRFYLSSRITGGWSVGGVFSEQFFLPASYNFRAFPPGSLGVLGEHFAVTQSELHFPLTPEFSQAVYLQGVAGLDAGAVSFEPSELAPQRVAAGVAGVNLGLGYGVLRLHFARPFNVGGIDPPNQWITHFSVFLLPMMF